MFTGCNALIGFLQLVAWLLTVNTKCGELDDDTSKAGATAAAALATELQVSSSDVAMTGCRPASKHHFSFRSLSECRNTTLQASVMPAVAGLAFAVSFASWYVSLVWVRQKKSSCLLLEGTHTFLFLVFLGPRESGCCF